METVRLRRIQEPSRAQRLQEAYIARAEIVPEGAYQTRDPNELPYSATWRYDPLGMWSRCAD
jgi:hypothetical protein